MVAPRRYFRASNRSSLIGLGELGADTDEQVRHATRSRIIGTRRSMSAFHAGTSAIQDPGLRNEARAATESYLYRLNGVETDAEAGPADLLDKAVRDLAALQGEFTSYQATVLKRTGAFQPMPAPPARLADLPEDTTFWTSVKQGGRLLLTKIGDAAMGTNYESVWRNQMMWENRLANLKATDPGDPRIREAEVRVVGARHQLETSPGFIAFVGSVIHETGKQIRLGPWSIPWSYILYGGIAVGALILMPRVLDTVGSASRMARLPRGAE